MKKEIKSGVIMAVSFGLTLGLIGITYATFVNISEVNTTGTLTADLMNNVINNQKDLDTRLGGLIIPDAVPSGAIMAFNLSVCPNGWSAADGTNSNPDLRGEFIRGLDNGRGVDSGRVLVSGQGDAIRNIIGTFGLNSVGNVTVGSAITNVSGVFEFAGGLGSIDDIDTNINNGSVYKSATFDASNVVPTAGENRPRNVALLYCVKD